MTMRNVKFKNLFLWFFSHHLWSFVSCFFCVSYQLTFTIGVHTISLSLSLVADEMVRARSSFLIKLSNITNFIYWFMFCFSRVDKKLIYNAFSFFKFNLLCFVVSSSAKKFYRGLDRSNWIVLLSLRYRRLSVEKGKIIYRKKNFSSKHQWIKVFGQVSITFFLRLCLRTGEKSFFLFCTLIACNVTFDTNLALLFYLSLLSILPPSNGSRSKSDSSIILFISL